MARMDWEGARQRERARGPFDPDLHVEPEAQWARSTDGIRLSPGKVTAETLALDWARFRKRSKAERREFELELRRHPKLLRLPKKDLAPCLSRADTVEELVRTATARNRRRLAEAAAKRTGLPASSLASLKQQAAAQGLTLQEMSKQTRVEPVKPKPRPKRKPRRGSSPG